MSDRVCIKCNEAKELNRKNFSITNGNTNTFRKVCNSCRNKASKEYYKNNKKSLNRKKKIHYENNKSLYFSYTLARRYYIKRARIEKELTDFVFKEAFDLCTLRLKSLGIRYHVDHTIPLRGKDVCGLHVWNNFQVIPEKENLIKGNSYVA